MKKACQLTKDKCLEVCDSVKFSSCFVDKFKRKNGIRSCLLHGEGAPASVAAAAEV